jgi:hypothetical protein
MALTFRILAMLALANSLSAQSVQRQALGPPSRVDIETLVRSPASYHERLVMVKGKIRQGNMTDMQNQIYELRGKNALRTVRIGQPVGAMRDLQFLSGEEVEIIGIFWDLSSPTVFERELRDYPGARVQQQNSMMGASMSQANLFIGVEEVTPVEKPPEVKGAEAEKRKEVVVPDLPPSAQVDLRELMSNPDPYYDELITVIGKFRGDNVYNDLPMRTKKTPRDFIIKVADVAIWVTGKRPRGKDFELNPERRRDTGKWLKVTGTPWTTEGVVYLKAKKIEMIPKPENPDLEPRKVADEIAELEAREPPPEVVFSMPLAGERSLPLNSEFRIQFSKDMEVASFDRNVDLIYSDDGPDDHSFPDMEISYDEPSRSLVVIPGKGLEPGKEIRVILYQGITDNDGRPLVPAPDASEVPEAAVILSFFTEEPL